MGNDKRCRNDSELMHQCDTNSSGENRSGWVTTSNGWGIQRDVVPTQDACTSAIQNTWGNNKHGRGKTNNEWGTKTDIGTTRNSSTSVVQNTSGNNRSGWQTTNNGWGTTINHAPVTQKNNTITTKNDTAVTAKSNTKMSANSSTSVVITSAAKKDSGSGMGKTFTNVTSNTQDGGHLSRPNRLETEIMLQRREHVVTTQSFETEQEDMRPSSWNLRRRFKATEKGTTISKKQRPKKKTSIAKYSTVSKETIDKRVLRFHKAVFNYNNKPNDSAADETEDDNKSCSSMESRHSYIIGGRSKGCNNLDCNDKAYNDEIHKVETFLKGLNSYEYSNGCYRCPCGNGMEKWREANDLWWITGAGTNESCAATCKKNAQALLTHCKDMVRNSKCPFHYATYLLVANKTEDHNMPNDLKAVLREYDCY